MRYYLHRISHHMEWSHPLLDERDLVSIGWADYGAAPTFVARHRHDWSTVAHTVAQDHPKARQRFGLQRFLEMAQGDRVIVPTWGAFHVYSVADNQRLVAKHIAPELVGLESWHGKRSMVNDAGYICESADPTQQIDLGFFRRVDAIAKNISREGYADAALTRRMKVRQTNVEVSDLRESIEHAVERFELNRPINVRDQVLEACACEVRKAVVRSLNPDKLEQLIMHYFHQQGANAYIPPKNERGKEGDADVVATFESLKLIVYVQAKHHEGTTDDWAVEQVKEYADSKDGVDDGYTRLAWVVSTAEGFSPKCRHAAKANNVRLVDGNELARMLLDAGIERLLG